MVKVLQFTSLKCGGAESVLINYYKNMQKEQVVFDFFVFSNQKEFYEDEVLQLGGKIYKGDPKKRISSAIKLLKSIGKQYDIVEIHTENAHSIVWVLICKWLGLKKVIVHSHSTNNVQKIQHNLSRLILNKLNIIRFACGDAAAEYMFGNNRKYYIVNNAIDVSSYLYNESLRNGIREKLSVTNQIVIGHAGRFIELKNHKYLLKICKEFIDEGIDIRLLLLGDGELKPEMENEAKAMGIWDKVIFTGNVKNVAAYMQAMDVFLLPSFYEGMPTVVVEAQASGLKCVISENITRDVNITGLVEFVDINLPPSVWKSKIEAIVPYKRVCDSKTLTIRGMDINAEAKKLERIYVLIGENHVEEIYKHSVTDMYS